MQGRLLNKLGVSLLSIVLAAAMVVSAAAQSNPKGNPRSMPKVGDMAPDFKLQYFDGQNEKEVSLSQYRGKKNVVLGFFIFAFTGG